MPTGEIEISVRELQPLSLAEPLPFSVAEQQPVGEQLRLTYRFLDLRRTVLHQRIQLRAEVISSVRRRMTDLGFTEFQTPILTSSSPEGARDFLVPSRMHPGQFYALPQAPQQFKQLLMVSGFDRYFQIAPCFRDEDARADRSPGEFYQLDVEMAFVEQEDVFAVMEDLFCGLFEEFSDSPVSKAPFPRIPYEEAILRYGTDKPDLRIDLEIVDLSDAFAESDFRLFQQIVAAGGVVRAICVPDIAARPRSFFDRLEAFARQQGGSGLAYAAVTGNGLRGPIASVVSKELLMRILEETTAGEGSVIFFVAGTRDGAPTLAGKLRVHLGDLLHLRQEQSYRSAGSSIFRCTKRMRSQAE